MHSRNAVHIVVPAYNEGSVIRRVAEELLHEYANVVVIDDASDDDTAEQSRRAGAIVLRHIMNRGQGAALQTGIDFALHRGAEIVVTFDGDGQHRVADIEEL